jgi:hypothetical protein
MSKRKRKPTYIHPNPDLLEHSLYLYPQVWLAVQADTKENVIAVQWAYGGYVHIVGKSRRKAVYTLHGFAAAFCNVCKLVGLS